MDKVRKQHGSIVLYEEKKDGEQYIRIAYADNPAIAPDAISRTWDKPGRKRECLYKRPRTSGCRFFMIRYSPHTYIDYSRLYVGYPKSKREYTFLKLYSDKDTITDRIERLKELINQNAVWDICLYR